MKQKVVSILRRLNLLPVAEQFRFYWVVLYNLPRNRSFLKSFPDFIVPPLSVMHDAHRTISLHTYWASGKMDADVIAGLIKKYKADAKSVLEWGCGPVRILRHLPALLPQVTQWWGTDYNATTIRWCQKSVPGVTFAQNGLKPPLPMHEKFDVIYGISVLTHLSGEQQKAWIQELRRHLNPGGCLILTTHGETSAASLLPEEHEQLRKEGIVVRSKVEEGKRCFVSYTSENYTIHTLFADMHVREHIPLGILQHQDTWVVQEK